MTNIVAERFDAGVRSGNRLDKDMIAVRISPDLRMAVAASPAYLKGKPPPLIPHDLTEHQSINLRLPPHGGLYAWEFEKDGQALNVRVTGQVTLNNTFLMLRAALDGSLTVGSGKGVFGLRADMDALAMTETAENRPYASTNPGCMHACGHDGHMAMLLGAAQLLSRRRDFDGTVRFIFQPAEEHGRGAAAMLADGLLERFPMDEIYGAHNIPGMPVGHVATRVGGIMASEDNFVIRITGRGGHAARPHTAIDPLVVGAEIVLALQTIVARSVDPGQPAVVSCTEFNTDGIRNALPTEIVIKGDTRSYSPDVQALLERRMRELCDGICRAHGATGSVAYTHEFAPTVNWPQCVPVAVAAASAVVGAENVEANVPAMMISEDFGAFLKVLPGAFVFIGNGDGDSPGATPLHNAKYDFNDLVVPLGARYFAELARVRLPQINPLKV